MKRFWILPLFLGSVTAAPLPVATLERTTPVAFQEEILPVFRKNCLACHNQTKSKAGLVMESPATILKGGDSGPAVVPGKAEESLLFLTSAHIEDPVMPPSGHSSRAVDLTPAQLALLKLWINQGAKGSSGAVAAAPQHWERTGRAAIYAVAISPDGHYAACGRGQTVQVYDLRSRTLCAELKDPAADGATHRDVVQSLAFAADGTLASGGFREVKLWRQPAWLPVATVPGKVAPAPVDPALIEKLAKLQVPFLPASQVARASLDRIVVLEPGKAPRLLDGATGKPLKELPARPDVEAELEQLGRDEAMAKRLATLHTAAIPKLEEGLKKEEEAATQAGTSLPVARQTAALRSAELAALQRQSKWIEAEVALLKTGTPEHKSAADKLTALAPKLTAAATQEADAKRAIELTERNRETGARLAGDALAKLALTRARKSEAEASVTALAERRKTLETLRGASDATAAAFSPDGTMLFVGLNGGAIHVYQATDGRYLESLAAPDGLVDLQIDAAGLHSGHRDAGRLTWRLDRPWELTGRIGDGLASDLLEDRVTALAFAAGGTRLVTGTGEASRSGVIQIWDVALRKELARNAEAHRDTIVAVALSPDQSKLVTASTDGLAKVFRAESLDLVRSLEAHTGQVLDVDWSHDGRMIVTAGADQQIKLWDAETGEVVKSLTGWTREVTSVSFLSAASEQVISTSGDKSVKLDAVPLGQGGQFLHTAAVSADGKWLATGDEDGNLQIWSADAKKVEMSFPAQGSGLASTGR